jgi:peptidoglycan/xylan/chitin deacetylase (PgdA/CDA1 family)
MSYVGERGYVAVMGTVFPLDHWLRNPSVLTRLCEWLAVPGGIVILHDGAERGKVTAEVLDELVPRLKSRGYEFARPDSLAAL